MLWLVLLPFRLLIGLVFAVLSLPFLLLAAPVAILLLPVVLLLWVPYLLLKIGVRVVAALLLLPLLAVGGLAALIFAGAIAAVAFPVLAIAAVCALIWALTLPFRMSPI